VSNPGDNPFNLDDFNLDAAAAGDSGGLSREAPSAAADTAEERPAEKPRRARLFDRLRQTSIFTVMLGLSLLAITIAVIGLWFELCRYNWDLGAKSVHAGTGSPGIHAVLSTTTATA